MRILSELAVLVATLAGIPVTIAAAMKLPAIGKPVRYIGRVLFVDPFIAAVKPIIEASIEESNVLLREIDRAVNTRHPSMPTLSDDVVEMKIKLDRIENRMFDEIPEIREKIENVMSRVDAIEECVRGASS